MVRVAPINLQYNPRTLWFDPGELDIKRDDPVVVLTARGVEFGRASGDVFEVDQAELKKLKCSLKPVKRIATKHDEEKAAEMARKSADALPIFKEMAAETNEDMRPVSVEYLLEGDKAVFYFEAEDRVDFRDLVRKLASRFHVRIDMRQIGVRDEARMVGGYGHCGQELCCRRLGGGFCPVSIRMAKEQDLSLNPQKISGVCGRLMCCLRYEFDAYKDFKSRAPKQNATVQTPDGPAKVVDLDVPREIVSLRIEGEKAVKVPLADLETKGDAARPNFVGAEAWERANTQAVMPLAGSSTFATSLFTGDDKLAQAGSVRHTGGGRARKGSSLSATIGETLDARAKREPSRKPRRRSTKVGGDAVPDSSAGKQKQRGAQDSKKNRGGKKQRGAEETARRRQSAGAGTGAGTGTGASRRPGGKDDARSRRAQPVSRGGGNTSPARDAGASGQPKQGPRPGQKSSGLRQRQAPKHASGDASRTPRRSSTFSVGGQQEHSTRQAGAQGGAGSAGGVRSNSSGVHVASNGAQGGASASSQGNGRRPRRRSHKAGGQAASGHGPGADGGATKRDARDE